MRGLRNIAFLSGILILCACGFAFLPEPTKKKVVKADLLGVWEYPADYGSTTVTMKPDFHAPAGPWVLEEASWWMMDSVINKGIDVSICGTADDRDPDSCFEMKKIR